MEAEIDAIRARLLDIANGVAQGRIEPRAGAAALTFLHSELEYFATALEDFVGLDSQLDDHLLRPAPEGSSATLSLRPKG